MVETSGAPLRPRGVRQLDAPRPIDVRVDEQGKPSAVRVARGWLLVGSVQNRWRVDDEWWRAAPIHRTFFEAVLEDGQRLVLLLDEAAGKWHRSRA